MEELLRDEIMADELYVAAVEGNVEVIKTQSDEYLRMKTHQMNNNILHIAIKNKRFSFAEAALKRFPQLLCERNLDGSNPLHVAAEVGNAAFVRRNCEQVTDMKPFRMQNLDGNTPLHVAIIHLNLEIATFLVEKDPYLATVVNRSMEAPLHLLAKFADGHENHMMSNKHKMKNIMLSSRFKVILGSIFIPSLVAHLHQKNMMSEQSDWGMNDSVPTQEKLFTVLTNLLLEKESNVANWRDASGLTPLHRVAQLNPAHNLEDDRTCPWRVPKPMMTKDIYVAAQEGDCEIFTRIERKELLLRKTENKNNNVLHIALMHGKNVFAEEAISIFPQLMSDRNSDGNTPLHIAAQNKDLNLMQKLLNRLMNDTSSLRVQNSKGNTVLHVALIHFNHAVADLLLQQDPYLNLILNDSKEAPLHLLLNDDYCPDRDEIIELSTLVNAIIMHGEQAAFYNPDSKHALKMVYLINKILKRASQVACWNNSSGLTPLHKAALLDKSSSYNISMIRLILWHCPQSAEVCDSFGKTILHYLVNRIEPSKENRRFLQDSRIGALVNHQDQEGNTPFHIMLTTADNFMVRFFFTDKSVRVNYDIQNNEGLTPDSWHEKYDIRKLLMEGHVMTKEECDAVEHGDVFFLKERKKYIGGLMQGKDVEGSPFLHKLLSLKNGSRIIPEEFLNFVRKHFSSFLAEKDRNGDTVCHILAKLEPHNIMLYMATAVGSDRSPKVMLHMLETLQYSGYHHPPYNEYTYDLECLGGATFFRGLMEICCDPNFLTESGVPRWLMQNMKGNTSFHEAVIAKNDLALIYLTEITTNIAVVNNRKETLCHLLASRIPLPPIDEEKLDDIIKNDTKDPDKFLDMDGLSPLMIAIRAGNIEFAERLCFVCPKLAELTDSNGQTFWHQLAKVPPKTVDFENGSFSKSDEAVWSQLEKKDKNESTALHLAIKNLRFDLAMGFLGHDGSVSSDSTHKFNKRLLLIANKDGETPGNMIGALPYLPPKFEKFIWKDSTMIGTRSMWGIPTTQMIEYVNTMGVIAALLTTMTFTAAFTVPGGLNQEKGTPLLMSYPSFQVFIIMDVLAMCLSMMVLFCLLWIITTGNKSKSVVLLDFSIILLLGSFYTTLLTFMTGLYATTHIVKPWIAIVSMVPCSMLLLLMHRCLVIKLIIPFGKVILVLHDRVYHYASESFKHANESRKKLMSSHVKRSCLRSNLPEPQPSSPERVSEVDVENNL